MFLDLWVFPDLTRCQVLDEDELEAALVNGCIKRALYNRAKQEIAKLIDNVKAGKFPPTIVKDIEERLHL